MSLTIKLSDAQAIALQAKAAAEGLSVEEWIQRMADVPPPTEGWVQRRREVLPSSEKRIHTVAAVEPPSDRPQQQPPIWEVIAGNMKDVPPEDFAALPKDGLSQIDHYVYGTPKRTL
jgi:hypothetical protein